MCTLHFNWFLYFVTVNTNNVHKTCNGLRVALLGNTRFMYFGTNLFLYGRIKNDGRREKLKSFLYFSSYILCKLYRFKIFNIEFFTNPKPFISRVFHYPVAEV